MVAAAPPAGMVATAVDLPGIRRGEENSSDIPPDPANKKPDAKWPPTAMASDPGAWLAVNDIDGRGSDNIWTTKPSGEEDREAAARKLLAGAGGRTVGTWKDEGGGIGSRRRLISKLDAHLGQDPRDYTTWQLELIDDEIFGGGDFLKELIWEDINGGTRLQERQRQHKRELPEVEERKRDRERCRTNVLDGGAEVYLSLRRELAWAGGFRGEKLRDYLAWEETIYIKGRQNLQPKVVDFTASSEMVDPEFMDVMVQRAEEQQREEREKEQEQSKLRAMEKQITEEVAETAAEEWLERLEEMSMDTISERDEEELEERSHQEEKENENMTTEQRTIRNNSGGITAGATEDPRGTAKTVPIVSPTSETNKLWVDTARATVDPEDLPHQVYITGENAAGATADPGGGKEVMIVTPTSTAELEEEERGKRRDRSKQRRGQRQERNNSTRTGILWKDLYPRKGMEGRRTLSEQEGAMEMIVAHLRKKGLRSRVIDFGYSRERTTWR